ncbi:MAG: ComF family protein, partial [Cyanobacteriota bacterium]
CNNTSSLCVCGNCIKEIRFNAIKPVKYFEDIPLYACSKYTGSMRQAILKLKFENKKDVARIISKLLYNYWKNTDLYSEKFEVVTVPIHKNKKKQRGYDQTELIAKYFAFLCGYEINNKLLIRDKETLPQYKLNFQERQENLQNAFKVNDKYIPTQKILLIDDISTTGSTLIESIKVLNQNNINEITILVICDVDLNKQYINVK